MAEQYTERMTDAIGAAMEAFVETLTEKLELEQNADMQELAIFNGAGYRVTYGQDASFDLTFSNQRGLESRDVPDALQWVFVRGTPVDYDEIAGEKVVILDTGMHIEVSQYEYDLVRSWLNA